MKKTACQYAIVRFTPFVETGEFANVGIVMMAARDRFFGFKLITNRHARVTHFFEELDPKVFRSTMVALKEELGRTHGMLKQHGFDTPLQTNEAGFADRMFQEIIRPRETIIHYSEPRVVLTLDPEATLQELYGFYVERTFVNKEYQEAILEKGVRALLNQAKIASRFVRAPVGDELYQAVFPFVEQHEGQAVKVIKPLNLMQDRPSKILDHGGQWTFRVHELKKRNVLPKRILFAVDGPNRDGARGEAFREVENMLEDAGVTVFPYCEKQKIMDFALTA